MLQAIELCEAERGDPRGRKRRYPAAMCPTCQTFHTVKRTGMRYLCKDCGHSFTVDAQGHQVKLSREIHTRALHAYDYVRRGHQVKLSREIHTATERVDSLNNARLMLNEIIAVGAIPVLPHAKRPHCFKCQKSVTGRGFHHRSRGGIDDVICDMCVRGTVTRKLFQ